MYKKLLAAAVAIVMILPTALFAAENTATTTSPAITTTPAAITTPTAVTTGTSITTGSAVTTTNAAITTPKAITAAKNDKLNDRQEAVVKSLALQSGKTYEQVKALFLKHNKGIGPTIKALGLNEKTAMKKINEYEAMMKKAAKAKVTVTVAVTTPKAVTTPQAVVTTPKAVTTTPQVIKVEVKVQENKQTPPGQAKKVEPAPKNNKK